MSTTPTTDFVNKVHVKLAQLLPVGRPLRAHIDRYSLFEADGIVTQQTVTAARFMTEPEVQAYVWMDPADPLIWDPANGDLLEKRAAAAARRFGLTGGTAVWVRGCDVHPNSRHNDVVAALVLLGDVLFVRATTGAVRRAIVRDDGPDENVYTVLINQLVRHYRLHLLRFDEDVTRAARDDLSSATLVDTCLEIGTVLQFGDSRPWDPRVSHERQYLNSMLGQGSVDDTARRTRLMGKRIVKLQAGGWPFSEDQMPQGFRVQVDDRGHVVKVEGKGKVPVPDPTTFSAVQRLWRLHAKGWTYLALGKEMAKLGVQRRCQQNDVPSYAELIATKNWAVLGDAAKTFFVNSSVTPSEDLEVYLQKVDLLRSGSFHTRIANEIRGGGITVAGLSPVMRDDKDVHGYFEVAAAWPTPINPRTGKAAPRFGLSEAELVASRERLIKELRAPRKVRGSGSRALVRAVRPSTWQDADHAFGVMSRMTNAGRYTDIILRAEVAEREKRNAPGWRYEAQHPKEYCIATYALGDLCGSVSNSFSRKVKAALAGTEGVLSRSVVTAPAANPDTDRLQRLEASITGVRTAFRALIGEVKALELFAASQHSLGDETGARRLFRQAATKRSEAGSVLGQWHDLRRQMGEVDSPVSAPTASDEGDLVLTLSAYMVDGLRRAAQRNGVGPVALAVVCGEHLIDWRMEVGAGDEGIRWHCTALLPMVDGSMARLELTGVIDNVRLPQGGRHQASALVVAKQVFLEGRTLEEVMGACHVSTSREQVIKFRVMPFLAANGVVAVAAKNAVVDHPVVGVQQLVMGRIAGDAVAADAWPLSLREAVLDYYFDPGAKGGFAACLDDTILIQRVLLTLAMHDPGREGIRAEVLARAAGCSADEIRELAAPRARDSGPKRPRFIETHPRHKDRVRLILCTFCPAKDRALADRALYLPEVARSGYAVVCACGRVPVPRARSDAAFWSQVVFGDEFTGPGLITRIARTSLRDEPQTGFVPMPPPLSLPRSALAA